MPDRRDDTISLLAAVIGEDLAIKLSARFGGLRLYIPHDPPVTGELVAVIGEEAAQRLGKSRHRGTFFEMPIEPGKVARIIELSNGDAKVTVSEIARLVGSTERHVYHVRREHREGGGEALWVHDPVDTNQIDLFVDPTPPTTL